jgi:peptide/nickel transport system substrate-binding protein
LKGRRGFAAALLLALLAAACGPGRPPGRTDAPSAAPIDRSLVIMATGEAASFASKEILASGFATPKGTEDIKVLLNAQLVYLDERGLPQPFLTDAVPDLSVGSWRVFPDGKMETTYRLRPSLSWHDRQPLTAEDFVFAWRVYATPEFGVSRLGGFRLVEEVSAPDLGTVVIRWRQPFPDAVSEQYVLSPLPQHILGQPFQQLPPDPFMGLTFWRDEYVGAGPWKLERREPGAFFEASAFDGFVFGRPRIERIRVIYTPDPNTAVATILGGGAHYSTQALLDAAEGLILEEKWGPNGGTVLWEPMAGRALAIQHRREYAVPQQLATDVRVRRALAHLIDKEAINEVVTSARGLTREIFTHPYADYYDAVLRAVPMRYRADPRLAQQLLEEAGFARGGDGVWATPRGERFTLEQWHLPSTGNERESQILVEGLRRFGIDATSHLWGIQRTSNEERAKTSGLFAGAADTVGFLAYHSEQIARPETRWTGNNRLGYANLELDRIADAFETTLDRSERIQLIAQMERLASEDLPAILLYYNPRCIAYVRGLMGVVRNLTPGAGQERLAWLWEWQS